VTVLTDAQTRSTMLEADASAVAGARRFARDVLTRWLLPELAEAACAGLSELVTWAVANDPAALVEITLVWDGPLLFTEVTDRCEQLPHRPAWLLSDEYAVTVLEESSLEWGAEMSTRGRLLWASFHTGRAEILPQESL
jgi:hypothetical protein